MAFKRTASMPLLALLLCKASLLAQIDRVPSAPDLRLGTTAPKEVTDWFRTAAIPLKTTSPDADFEDLMPLACVVGDARIVAIGEATHGTREFFQIKHRMLEFLVDKMGFTLFGIEANWPESLAVNDYVLNGKGDPAVALRGLGFWSWNTEEVLDMIRWMRRYNQIPAHTKKVQFLGFDMQTARVSVSNVKDYLEKVDPAESLRAAKILAPLADATRERSYAHQVLSLRRETAEGIKSLLNVFDQRKAVYVAASSRLEWILAQHNLEIVKQAEELYSSKDPSIRDRYMAQNVKWILDNQPPGAKIMLWAHNGHVGTAENTSHDPMGKILRQTYGREMVVCGFSFYQGSFRARPAFGVPHQSTFLVGPAPPESLDSALAETGIPLFAVDLRTAPSGAIREWIDTPHPMRTVGGVYIEARPNFFFANVKPGSFDVIFFVNQTSPSEANPPLRQQIQTGFTQD